MRNSRLDRVPASSRRCSHAFNPAAPPARPANHQILALRRMNTTKIKNPRRGRCREGRRDQRDQRLRRPGRAGTSTGGIGGSRVKGTPLGTRLGGVCRTSRFPCAATIPRKRAPACRCPPSRRAGSRSCAQGGFITRQLARKLVDLAYRRCGQPKDDHQRQQRHAQDSDNSRNIRTLIERTSRRRSSQHRKRDRHQHFAAEMSAATTITATAPSPAPPQQTGLASRSTPLVIVDRWSQVAGATVRAMGFAARLTFVVRQEVVQAALEMLGGKRDCSIR